MFLSRLALREYTGRQRRSAVVRQLRRMGHRFVLDADGWPRVLVSTIERELGPMPAGAAAYEIDLGALESLGLS